MYVCVTDPWLEWKETSRQQEPISGVCGDLMILVGPCPLGFNPKGRLGRCHQILSDCDPGVEGKPSTFLERDSDRQAALSQVPFPAPSPVLTVHPFPCTTQPAPPLPAAPKPEPTQGTVASRALFPGPLSLSCQLCSSACRWNWGLLAPRGHFQSAPLPPPSFESDVVRFASLSFALISQRF